MMTGLAFLAALQCGWAWAYRGGSSGLPIPYARWFSLLLTPALIVLAYSLAVELTMIERALLVLFAAAYAGASAPGWGRRMDLGSNDLPDDEWGARIRDAVFASKSSFSRDLVGLYMRMLWFVPAGLILGWLAPVLALPVAALVLLAPMIWVAEHKWIKPTAWAAVTLPWNRRKSVAWVEWGIGAMNALTTCAAVLLVG